MTALISKALIIDRPWIDMILNGEKTWEMRSQATNLRGWIGLIEKGTGQVVGIANLVDCQPRLDRTELLASIARHGIPAAKIREGAVDNWHTPWVLASARRLSAPVPYRHPPGAVIWVNLDADVTRAVCDRVAGIPDQGLAAVRMVHNAPRVQPISFTPPASSPLPRHAAQHAAKASIGVLIGASILTEGNLKNNHFYLSHYLHLLPQDAIGGSNRTERAPRTLLLDWGGKGLVETDIAGDKKIFRERGWVKSFFLQSDARAGDKVCLYEIAPYQYTVQLQRN